MQVIEDAFVLGCAFGLDPKIRRRAVNPDVVVVSDAGLDPRARLEP